MPLSRVGLLALSALSLSTVLLISSIYPSLSPVSLPPPSPLALFLTAWGDKAGYIGLLGVGAVLAGTFLTTLLTYLLGDIKETERMMLIDNSKAKFIDMSFLGGVVLMEAREENFNIIAMFMLIMVFANIHWLVKSRYKALLQNLSASQSPFSSKLENLPKVRSTENWSL